MAHSWILLRKPLEWKMVEHTVHEMHKIGLLDEDEYSPNVHLQVSYVQKYCSLDQISKWRDEKTTTDERWIQMLCKLREDERDIQQFTYIIGYLLSLPGSTAPVERIFSSVNKIWTVDKSRLKTETIEAMLMVK